MKAMASTIMYNYSSSFVKGPVRKQIGACSVDHKELVEVDGGGGPNSKFINIGIQVISS